MKIYLVYETDVWFTYGSRELLGAFNSKETLMETLVNKGVLDYDDATYLMEHRQMKKGDIGYDIETVKLNEFLG